MPQLTLALQEIEALALQALRQSGVSRFAARETVAALMAAEQAGISSHGFARLPYYLAQLNSGKLAADAEPILSGRGAVIQVDAAYGLAFPALHIGLSQGIKQVRTSGIVAISVQHSHHFGMAGYYVEQAARAGVVALAMSNSPAAMAPWGGSQPLMGTNPLAFASPRDRADPLVIDLSLSEVARGKVMLASEQQQAIPLGWALDKEGHPTTDAQAALAGSMLPSGGAKGAALALMVELLTAGLGGSNFAFQASSFFTPDGPAPAIAQLLLLLDPAFFHSGYLTHIETLFSAVLAQQGTRLPGSRRAGIRAAQQTELSLSADLVRTLQCAARLTND